MENLEKIEYSTDDPIVQKIEQSLNKLQTELTAETNKINSNNKSLSQAIKDLTDKVDAIKHDQEVIKK